MKRQAAIMQVLIIEDNFSLREIYHEALTFEGYDVTAIMDNNQAQALLQERQFDVVISDLLQSADQTQEWLDELSELKKSVGTRVLVVSGRSEMAHVCRGIGLEFYAKPISALELSAVLQQQEEEV